MFALFVNDKQTKQFNRSDMTAYLVKYYRLTVEEIESLFTNWELTIECGMTINFELVPAPQ